MNVALAKFFSGCFCITVFTVGAAEWPQYRGPNHDAISTERINKHWSGSVTNPVWLVYLTNGITSLTVSGGRVFTEVAGDSHVEGPYVLPHREFCVALSATNGEILWSTEIDSRGDSQAQDSHLYPNLGVGYTDDGPRSTPTVNDGSVYVLSSYHKLYRLNATNGAVIWSTNLLAGFVCNVIPWQSAASPVLENGLLFVSLNCGSLSLVAFHAEDGTLAWRSQDEYMTHSTPVLATIHGVRHLIFATQSGLVAVDPQTGTLLWKFPLPYNGISLASSPVVYQDAVFVTSDYGTGGFAVRVIQTNSTFAAVSLWSDPGAESHWTTPVCYQGALFSTFLPDYVEAELRCIDIFTGATKWVREGFGRGAPLLVGTNLLVITERGDLVLVAADTNAFTELGRFQAIPNFDASHNKCWNALALSDGQIYVRSTAYAARYDLSVPDVRLDLPQFAPGNKLNFTIRTANGTPLDSTRLTGMELRASTNATLIPSLWTKLTNSLVLTNGVVLVTNVDAPPPRRFFLISEPK